MSITWSVRGTEEFLNLANTNAYALMEWLGYAPDYCGQWDPSDLEARCRRALWPEIQKRDAGVPDVQEGRVYTFGRPAGYMSEKAEALLTLAQLAKSLGENVRFG
jgi:hypothetical protein